MRIFLTGDRALHPVLAVEWAHAALIRTVLSADEGVAVEVVTGTGGGVEAAVRYLLGSGVQAYGPVLADDERAGDDVLRATFEAARADGVEAAVVLHPDPLGSHVARAALAVWGDAVTILPSAVVD